MSLPTFNDPHLTKKEIFNYVALLVIPFLILVLTDYFPMSLEIKTNIVLIAFAICMGIFFYNAKKGYRQVNELGMNGDQKQYKTHFGSYALRKAGANGVLIACVLLVIILILSTIKHFFV